jgi:undecaprenyl-diphosphatase
MDLAVDEWFETHLRHRPWIDRVMYSASAVGDHGYIWLALGVLQAVRQHDKRDWRRPLVRVSAGLGLESALVNGPVKWLFRRTRPVHEGPRPLHLRSPLTSSFPSGHASSAFFGAALLRDHDPWWPMYYAIAVAVAASRIHVKVHHASDVLGGIAIGAGLGELTRRLFPVSAG